MRINYMSNRDFYNQKHNKRTSDAISFYLKTKDILKTVEKYASSRYSKIDIINDIGSNLIIDDELIVDLFFDSKLNRIISAFMNHFNNKPNLSEIEKSIINYIDNRYKDSECRKETIYRIKNKIEVHPLCAECHKNKVHFTGNKYIFTKFCSKKCSRNNEDTKRNYTNKLIEKYGDPHYNNTEQNQKTCMERYGKTNVFATDWCKDKIKTYWNDNYGVDNPNQVEEIRNRHNFEELTKKGIETKRKNNTFNVSKPEEECYKILCVVYGKKDVKRQYNKDSRYPFLCDFYIKSKDLFIEYNGHWTHGKHPFDENNTNDIELLNVWSKRSMDKKFYKVAINVWTNHDVIKRTTAQNNKINYIEFWSLDEVKNYYNIETV